MAWRSASTSPPASTSCTAEPTSSKSTGNELVPGSVTERLFFYLAEYSAATEQRGGIEEEEIEVLELPLAHALSMVATGEIQDGKTIMLWQNLRLQQFTA